jgi:hypothetical protein
MACTNCGCKNKPCGCEDGPLTTPAPCNPIGCPDPYPCSEVIDAQCVLYSGDPIICDQDTVVDTGDTVADALNQVVDYFCNPAPAQCCPTFDVDINKADTEIYRLDSTLTNGTAPFTYEWTVEQNEFQGLAFTGSTTSANVLLELVPDNYVDAPALPTLIYQVLVKVKVTDSVGQIATAYYNAVFRAFN